MLSILDIQKFLKETLEKEPIAEILPEPEPEPSPEPDVVPDDGAIIEPEPEIEAELVNETAPETAPEPDEEEQEPEQEEEQEPEQEQGPQPEIETNPLPEPEQEKGLIIAPLGFMEDSFNRAMTFKQTGSNVVYKNLFEIDLSVTTRASHPAEAEADINYIYEKLRNKTNFTVGEYAGIHMRPISFPSYLGEYESGLFYFTVVFKLLLEEKHNG